MDPTMGFCSPCIDEEEEEEDDTVLPLVPSATTPPPLSTLPPPTTAKNNNKDTDAEPVVQSTLYIPTMCCATEVPAVRRALRPWPHRIDIVLRQVHVTTSSTTPLTTLQLQLQASGFPSEIVVDGTRTVVQCGEDGASTLHPAVLFRIPRQHTSRHAAAVQQQQSDQRPSMVPSALEALLEKFEWVNDDDDDHSCRLLSIHFDPTLLSVEYLTQALQDHYDDSTIQQHTSQQQSQQHQLLQVWQQHPTICIAGIGWVWSSLADVLQWHAIWMWAPAITAVVVGLYPLVGGNGTSFSALFRPRRLDSTTLMLIAAVGSLLLGDAAEAASVAFVFRLGRAAEQRAATAAANALQALQRPAPPILDATTGLFVPAARVTTGQLQRVRPGDVIAATSIVVDGTTWIDAARVTGEARAQCVGVNDTVTAGCANVGDTSLVVRATQPAPVPVGAAVRAAASAPTERVTAVNAFAAVYTPILLSIAAVLAIVPWVYWVLVVAVATESSGSATSAAAAIALLWTRRALILLVVACPCALQLATPVAYTAGVAAAARQQILVQSGSVLEAVAQLGTVFVDKTGTLTTGQFTLAEWHVWDSSMTREATLELAARMEQNSTHPLATTIVEAAASTNLRPVNDHRLIPGQGVTALADGKVTFIGNERLVQAMGMELRLEQRTLVDTWNRRTGGTIGFLGIQGVGILAAYCVTDTVRPEAAVLVHEMQTKLGIDVVMLSGDAAPAANAVAQQLGIRYVQSQLLPDDKLHVVASAKRPPPTSIWQHSYFCNPHKTVLFCGDGVNDALALGAAADIGVAMGDAAAINLDIADMTLMDSDVSKLVAAHNLGKRVVRTVYENIGFSLTFKLVVTGLTLAGYVTLSYAIASDVGSLLLVTMNALQLLPPSASSVQRKKRLSEVAIKVRRWIPAFMGKRYNRIPMTNMITPTNGVAVTISLSTDDEEEHEQPQQPNTPVELELL